MDRRTFVALIGAAGLCYPSVGRPQALAKHHVKIWLRAFIPAPHPSVPDYVKKAANGRQVIEAPWVPPLGDIGLLKGTCFATDGRGFSLDPRASSRVLVAIELAAQGRNLIVLSKTIEIGETHNVDCKSGVELRPPQKATAETVAIGELQTSGFLKTVNVRISSPNPYFKVAGISTAPRIDMDVVIQYDGLSRMLKIFGTAGYFPSFEILSSIDGGPITAIAKIDPYKSSTAVDLFDFGTGINTRNFSTSIKLE